MTIRNLKRSEMGLIYLAHVNFRLVDCGRPVYSISCTPEHVRMRTSIPSHICPSAGCVEFVEMLKVHPEEHNMLKPFTAFDPEVVFLIDYMADETGWVHGTQEGYLAEKDERACQDDPAGSEILL